MPFSEETRKALLEKAVANLSIDASADSMKRVRERLEAVAAELALEWLSGELRFETQGQQTEHWLNRVYETLFEDEQPDGSRIYARFNLPLPRAQYVTRLLLARRRTQWRTKARAEAEHALRNHEKKAREQVGKGNRAHSYESPMSRGALDELMIVYDQTLTAAGDETFSPPRRQSASPSRVFVGMTAETICAILDHIAATGDK
jgi:hypothetical protein